MGIGKFRHLMQCSTPQGYFVILAIDHRANLKSALDKAAPQPLTDEDFQAFKLQVLENLMSDATAVLIDPAYGIAAGVADGLISGQHGILAPLEVTDYDVHPSQRELAFIEGWSVEKIKQSGGTGVKLLLNYHPDTPRTQEKHDLVARIVEECDRHQIPFFLEPIVYSPDPKTPLTPVEKREFIIESAHILSRMGIDVLKTEFPGDPGEDEATWKAALYDLNKACVVPWALLSAGVDYPTFLRQATLACEAGASGVIVGRAIWSEAVTLQGEERDHFLNTTARDRMQELAQVCAAEAADWRTRYPIPDSTFDWYLG